MDMNRRKHMNLSGINKGALFGIVGSDSPRMALGNTSPRCWTCRWRWWCSRKQKTDLIPKLIFIKVLKSFWNGNLERLILGKHQAPIFLRSPWCCWCWLCGCHPVLSVRGMSQSSPRFHLLLQRISWSPVTCRQTAAWLILPRSNVLHSKFCVLPQTHWVDFQLFTILRILENLLSFLCLSSSICRMVWLHYQPFLSFTIFRTVWLLCLPWLSFPICRTVWLFYLPCLSLSLCRTVWLCTCHDSVPPSVEQYDCFTCHFSVYPYVEQRDCVPAMTQFPYL